MNIKINKILAIICSIVFIITINCFVIFRYDLFYNDITFQKEPFILSIITTFILCILLSIKIEFKNNLNKIYAIVCTIFSVFYITYILELLNNNSIFFINITRLSFNFILISIFYFLLFCITNKLKFSIIFSNVILFIFGFVNYTLNTIRGAPLSFLDILVANTGLELFSTYTIKIYYYLILAIISFLILLVLNSKINYKFEISKKNIIVRVVGFFLSIILIISLFFTNLIQIFKLHTDLWAPSEEYKYNGFLASFFKNTHELIIKKPTNYSIETIENLYNHINNKDSNSSNLVLENNNSDKKLPNIIVIVNESFADMKIQKDFETSEDYLPFFNSLSNNTIKGNAHSSIIGGRTPNSEWEFLTNHTLSMFSYGTIPFQQFINKPSNSSLINILEAQGYTTYAIHPWYKKGYRRDYVYPLLGFDKSYFLEDLESELDFVRTFPSDLSTYKQIIKLYEDKNENENFFNYTLTMQNHSNYEYHYNDFKNTISISNIDNCPKTEQYLSLLKKSDEAFEYLINYFSNVEEDTIILFFGDHQPPYLDWKFTYYLNEGKDPNSLEDIEKAYITPFVLWTNFEIPKIEMSDISLNYLSVLLMDIAGLETTTYMDFLRELQKEIPVITGHGYIDKNGIYHNLEEENNYKNLINQYHILQYNNMFDTKNTVNKMFELK